MKINGNFPCQLSGAGCRSSWRAVFPTFNNGIQVNERAELNPFGNVYICVFFSIEPAALCFKSMALLWGWSWTSEISGTSPYEASVVYRSTLSSTSAFRVFGMYLIWSLIAPSSYLYSRVSWGGVGVLEKVFSVCSSLLIQLVVHIYFHLFLVTIL